MLIEESVKYVQMQIDENRERLLFSLLCETSFNGAFYAELRESQDVKKGILYLLQEEPRYVENHFHMASIEYLHRLRSHNNQFPEIIDALEYFNYRPYIEKMQLEGADYCDVMTLLKDNPLPDAEGTACGLDGHTIVFCSFVGCKSRYSYWVYPPNGYDHLRIIVNTISKYLKEPYRKYVFLEDKPRRP